MGKTNRRPYTGSKAFDKTCRCHGGCPTCESSRQHKNNKKLTLKQALNQMESGED
tara:strand:- start:1149 stop:1313 length:165 start_codon:yes stop_codon:yes gene_type:complete